MAWIRRGPVPRFEGDAAELARLRLVIVRHEVAVAIERRLDRGVTDLYPGVPRMRPLRDQQARVDAAQVVKLDVLELRSAPRPPFDIERRPRLEMAHGTACVHIFVPTAPAFSAVVGSSCLASIALTKSPKP